MRIIRYDDISFKCPNCGALIELKEYELNEPNWAADHACDQLVDSDGEAYCKKCGESFTLWVLNDFDSVYVQIEGCEPAEVGQISAKKSAKEGAGPSCAFSRCISKNNLILSQSFKMDYVFLGCKIGKSSYAILYQANSSKPNT